MVISSRTTKEYNRWVHAGFLRKKRSPRISVARQKRNIRLLGGWSACVHVSKAHVPVVEVDETAKGDGRFLVPSVPSVGRLGAHVVVEPVKAVVGDVQHAECWCRGLGYDPVLFVGVVRAYFVDDDAEGRLAQRTARLHFAPFEQTFVAERVEALVGEAARLVRDFEQAYGTRFGVVPLFADFRGNC